MLPRCPYGTLAIVVEPEVDSVGGWLVAAALLVDFVVAVNLFIEVEEVSVHCSDRLRKLVVLVRSAFSMV